MASRSYNDKRPDTNAWKCPVCKKAKAKPKLLPCSHSFCWPCLEDVAHQLTGGKFPCPVCRETITVPSRGVAAFKVNFYIEQQIDSPKFPCKNAHTKLREIELYCRECCSYICLECKLNEHLSHNTEQVESLAEAKRDDLTAKKDELDDNVVSIERKQKQFLQEQQDVEDKKAAVKTEILRRHQLMVDTADRCRDDALSTLDSVSDLIDSQLEEQIGDLKGFKGRLNMFQKQIERCLEEEEEGMYFLETATDILTDMNTLKETFQNAQGITITTLSRPVLSFAVSADVTRSTQQQFLGPVLRKDMASEPVDCTTEEVEEVFSCGSDDASKEVLSLFPKRNENVLVCYEPSVVGDKENSRPFELYNLKGNLLAEGSSAICRTNFMDKDTDAALCLGDQEPGYFYTYAKSGKLSMAMVNKNLQGGTCFMSLVVAKKSTLTIARKDPFTPQCWPHRGFDVDKEDSIVAVVEEAAADATGGQRRVCLYRKPEPDPIAIYEPPSPEIFRPTDVCFCEIQGREALLVTDELGDCVHVLHVEGSRLVFSHYLAAGHPLLIQPTALNVDMAGDVWLACRGGAVLRLQLTEDDGSSNDQGAENV